MAAIGLLASWPDVAAGASSAKGPNPNCPARARALVEHFIGADCLDCWRAAPPQPGQSRVPGAEAVGADEWSLDWIVPARADDAPMAPGALPEGAERLARLGAPLSARLDTPPAGFDTATELAGRDASRRFSIHSSLPYQGYFGVQMHAKGLWPVGSTGWISLVELLPVGTRDTLIPRHLVRALVGPVNLPATAAATDAVAPLFALRWPENAHPELLMATAWIEGRDGRILQITSDRCPEPR